MSGKILVVLQRPSSSAGRVGRALERRGFTLDCCHEALPATMDGHDAAVVFGGPMSANDGETQPFIRRQLDWIPMAVASGKPFLGICLGAQLLARALGAGVVGRADSLAEIGYHRVRPAPAASEFLDAPRHFYHWNREGFDLPPGAQLLAAGDIFPNQAFRYGFNAFGVQFHPEVTRAIIHRWTTNAASRPPVPGAQTQDEQLRGNLLYESASTAWLEGFMDLWAPLPPTP